MEAFVQVDNNPEDEEGKSQTLWLFVLYVFNKDYIRFDCDDSFIDA